MLRNTSRTTFRRAAIAAAAATAFAGAAMLVSFPADAQQANATPVPASIEGVTLGTDCKTYKPGVLMADTRCLILKEQLLDAQGRALDADGKRLVILNACLRALKDYKDKAPDKFRELGPITRENACDAASRIPKPTAGRPALGG